MTTLVVESRSENLIKSRPSAQEVKLMSRALYYLASEVSWQSKWVEKYTSDHSSELRDHRSKLTTISIRLSEIQDEYMGSSSRTEALCALATSNLRLGRIIDLSEHSAGNNWNYISKKISEVASKIWEAHDHMNNYFCLMPEGNDTNCFMDSPWEDWMNWNRPEENYGEAAQKQSDKDHPITNPEIKMNWRAKARQVAAAAKATLSNQ